MSVLWLGVVGLGVLLTILVLSPLLCGSDVAWQATRAAAVGFLWVGLAETFIGG